MHFSLAHMLNISCTILLSIFYTEYVINVNNIFYVTIQQYCLIIIEDDSKAWSWNVLDLIFNKNFEYTCKHFFTYEFIVGSDWHFLILWFIFFKVFYVFCQYFNNTFIEMKIKNSKSWYKIKFQLYYTFLKILSIIRK